MTASLTAIAELVQRESGIRLDTSQHTALRAALERTLPRADAASFLRRLTDPALGPQLVGRLLDELTVKETYFLRDRRQLESIDWRSLLDRAHANGSDRVRVWSAACATGEEAYTLALLASEAFATPEPPVAVHATDVSAAALDRARGGTYRPRAVRELAPWQVDLYFRRDDDCYVVDDRLRRLVRFAQHNLVTEPAPPAGHAAFELILCRNVLIYFDGETVEQVVGSLERALAESGTLVLGAADALCASARRLTANANAPFPPPRPAPAPRRLRRPLGRTPTAEAPDEVELLTSAVGAAAAADVIADATRLLESDPHNATAHYLRGLGELETGDAEAAVRSLRRALFAEPRFGLAAFKLGRAHEATGDAAAARRAYEQALRTLTTDGGERRDELLGQVDTEDVATAARTRLAALRTAAQVSGGGRRSPG
jgi:chemotaxis protein methyltransferase CheR